MVDRRQFLKTMGMGSLLPLLTHLQSSYGGDSVTGKKNVFFISVDDLNDWVGCLGGHPQVKTPNLDRLASMGMLFENAHSAIPVCKHDIVKNGTYFRNEAMFKDVITLPEHFKHLGYSVSGSGKIFHHHDRRSWNKYWPDTDRGFFEIETPKERLSGLPQRNIFDKGFDWGSLGIDIEKLGDWSVAEYTIRRIAELPKTPFFLGCGLYKPHLPWYVPQKYFDLYPLETLQLPVVMADDLSDVPDMGVAFSRPDYDHAFVLKYGKWKEAVQAYLASISFMDDMLGKVLDAFLASKHKNNTIIVFWSDHGWHLGEKLHWRKQTLWEEATRVPLIICAPGVTTANTRSKSPVSLLDIYPTLVELCGLSLPKSHHLDGKSLVPLLKDPSRIDPEPALTHWKNKSVSARDENWRYIHYGDGQQELYDHRKDPNEWNNLAGLPEYKDKINELKKWVDESY